MRIYIPFDKERRYFVYAILPEPSSLGEDEIYFKVGKWYIRYSKTENTFEIQGVRNVVKEKVDSIKRRLGRLRA